MKKVVSSLLVVPILLNSVSLASLGIYKEETVYVNLDSNLTICTNNPRCPDNYNKLILNKSECIDNCGRDPIFMYENDGYCSDKTNYFNISLEFENTKKYLLNSYNKSEYY